MPQAQHIEVFKYNMMLTVLSAIKRVISLFLLSEEKTNHGHMEVKQLASDHTAFRQLSQSLNSDILSGNMCYRNRGKEMISSVQFSCSVVSDSLQPHGLQHARPPCPSPTPGVYSNSRPLS